MLKYTYNLAKTAQLDSGTTAQLESKACDCSIRVSQYFVFFNSS